jgi:protein phosphatase
MPSAQRGQPEPEPPGSIPEGGDRSDLKFEAVGVTDIGRQRKHNEDHVLLRPELDLFVVADGMGGHNAGDIASRLATASLRNFYEATHDGAEPEKQLVDGYAELDGDAQRLAAAIRKANRDVFEISSTYRQHHGMGSTVVAAYLSRSVGVMHVGHVGDSRCYRYRDGTLEQLTHDHSLINDALALKPDLTPDELARLPKNIITRALGMRDDVKVDIRSDEVREGDIYLLCSDGLSGMVGEDDIANVLAALYAIPDSDLREACETLVTLANDAGGTDNITALLIRIDELPSNLEGAAEPEASEPPAEAEPEADGPEVEVEADGPPRLTTQELVALAEESPVECSACGASVSSSNAFCTECGASLPLPLP